jgi:hypothetical protein
MAKGSSINGNGGCDGGGNNSYTIAASLCPITS